MFTNYRDEAATLAADLVNTVGSISGYDHLTDLGALRDFLAGHGLSGGSVTDGDLEAVRGVRGRLREVFWATSDEDRAAPLNALLERAHPRVTKHDGTWHMHYLDDDASLGDRIGVLTAMGLAALITDLGPERLGLCSADDCKDVFVDTSRNRSRRYCDETCSTRMNVAAYRARRKVGSA